MTAIDDLTRLNHMRDAAQEILEFMEGQSKKSLESNRMLQMAVMKELEILGEAANNISAECQRQYPQLPWRQMIGMRNRLVHVYFGVDVDVIWRTFQENLVPLIQQLDRIIPLLSDDSSKN